MRGILATLIIVAVHVNAAETAFPAKGEELFTNDRVRQILITIPPEGIAELRTNSRAYVSAVVHDGTNAFQRVGIHLKGSTGSFRKIDDKPGFTLSFDKFLPQQRFYGLSKIHLNNSVEDPSYMNELLGSETFREAGIPAARVTHALVQLNGKKLGLYVLKDGFTEDFLGLYFRHPTGNLYEPGRGHDVDEPLDRQLGAGPDARDLETLAAAALEPDLMRRWQRVHRALDVDRFITFMALEILIGHRDGYCLARNNFRIYHDVDTGRMMFFPHGMDQLFGNPRAPLQPQMNGLLARAVMEIPEGRQQYRRRCAVLLTNVLDLAALNHRIDHTLPSLSAPLDAAQARLLEAEVGALRKRIESRVHNLQQQVQEHPIELLRFEKGVARLADWRPVDVPAGGSLTQSNSPDGKRILTIHAGPVTAASWRSKVLLTPGKYQFEGNLRTSAVQPLKFGKTHGACLRVAEIPRLRAPVNGSQAWTRFQVTLGVVKPEQEIELICELRASNGEAWFDLESLRLLRIE